MNKQYNLLSPTKNNLINQIREFNEFGQKTLVHEKNGIHYFINEFWTARQRQAHKVHEISYRACFKPQLPAFFIERLSERGDVVYDPFMGRGTTPIEAAIRGRIPYGNDINPLSIALVDPRIKTPKLSEIQIRLSEIPWDKFLGFENKDLLAFYHPRTLGHIEGLRKWLLNKQSNNTLDNIDAWIRMVALNRLTGHSSGFFSVYTLPPNQAVSIESQIKINEKRNQVPQYRIVSDIIYKKSKSLLANGLVNVSNSFFLTEEAGSTSMIPINSVTLTVTSPPFLDIVSYELDNWLRCWFLGVNPKDVRISKYRNIYEWQNFISQTLNELVRITKAGGHIAFEVGEVRNGNIKLEDYVIEEAKKLPIEILGVLVNQQNFTKTSNCWGVSNNQGGTNTNRVVLMKVNP